MKKRSNKKNNFIPIIAIVFFALFILAGCGSSGGGGGSGTTSVSISMETPPASASAAGGVSAQASVPRIVSSIVIEISGDGMSTKSRTIAVSPGATVTESFEVSNGDRTFSARAYSSTGILLYEAIPKTVNLSGTSVPIDLQMVLIDVKLGLNMAMAALESGDIVTARDLFRAAVAKYEASNSASLAAGYIEEQGKEISYFFYALTRVLALLVDMEHDTDNDGFYDSGDIFDFFGCSNDGRDPWNFDMDFSTSEDPLFNGMICPGILEVNYPGQEMRNFLQRVIDEVEGAIGNLADGNVSESFNIYWTEPFNGEYVESDYGDAIFLRAVFKAAMAAYKVVEAYDPNVNIPAGTNIETLTKQDFFSLNSTFPVMTGSPSASTVWQGGALDDMEAALAAIETEIFGGDGDQSDDWINMGDTAVESIGNILDARADIAKARSCYNSGNYAECIVDDNETDDPSDDTVIDLGPYFSGTVHINTLWPSFNGDDPTGFLPSPDLGGMLTLIKGSAPADLNADEDDDDNADIFQSNLYYVYGGILSEPMIYEDACEDPVRYYNFALLGTAATESNAVTFIGSGNFEYYVIKFEPKDLGFFSGLVNPDIHLDAIELLDIEDTHISYLYSGWTNFYAPNIFGPNDSFPSWIDDNSNCIIVDNWNYQADKVTVYTVQ